MSDSAKKALVLVPCCKEKCVGSAGVGIEPIKGISSLRQYLLDCITKTINLASRPRNSCGILNSNAPRTPAAKLYCGKFYKPCSQAISTKYANVHILIVSAFYGLAQPEENLAEYELEMKDEMKDALGSGQKIYQFWIKAGLPGILRQYILDHKISFVWSLLADSHDYPYHRVFHQFWLMPPEGVKCYHVKALNANGKSVGSGSAQKRGEWLNEVFTTNPDLLCLPDSLPNSFQSIKGFSFHYAPA